MKTFNDVMEVLSFNELWNLLNDPKELDDIIFQCVINWCRPKKVTNGQSFIDMALESKSFNSKSEIIRNFKGNALKWNGKKIIDLEYKCNLLNPGWGVIQIGKKNHIVVISKNFITTYDGEVC